MTREQAIQQIEENSGKGWVALVNEVFDRLPDHITIESAHNYYSGLKFDLRPRDEVFESYLRDIYERSQEICEVCGAPGTYAILDGWESTVCPLHYDTFEGPKHRN